MFRKFAFAITAVTASFAQAAPTLAQDRKADLEALDAQLPGVLVNDPTRIDWESYGAEMEASAVVDPSIPGGGAARRFEVKQADEFIYAAGANIPIVKKVRRGDDITVGFYARTIEAQTASGKGDLRIRFQEDEPPYPGFGETVLEIGSEWEWYEVTAKAEAGLYPKDGIIAVQFGRTRQIIEIGQAIVVSGATSIISGVKPTAPRPQPVAAPSSELPKPLVGVGTLLNNPGNRIWSFAAPNGRYEMRDDESIWLGNATRLTSLNGSGEEPAIIARMPIEGRIEEGDILLIAVAAKTVGAASTDGLSLIHI